ncbi:transposase [Streptomyces cinereoruber]|uniref:transposase n=1 Tax=Streptomyces cinereoruber TaxID=67260 RepID=UPI00363B0523
MITRRIRRDRVTPTRPQDQPAKATLEGWLYLATVLDLATREIIGYAMAAHHRASLVVDALKMAAGRGGLEAGCVMHSDRGSEYTSSQFRREIKKLGMRQSMGRTGSCYDNAAAESFFGLLKAEIGTRMWDSRQAARATSSASSKSSTTAPGSADIPSTGTSPRSIPGSCCSTISPPQRRNTLSNIRGGP